jgi:hypothetical protein
MKKKPLRWKPKRVLRLPDLDHAKTAVLNSLGSPDSERSYRFAIDDFIAWYCSEPRLAFNKPLFSVTVYNSKLATYVPPRSMCASLQSVALHMKRQIVVCSVQNLPLAFAELRVQKSSGSGSETG